MERFVRRLRRAALLSAVFLGLGGPAHAATCESLAALDIPHAKIMRAEAITDGNFSAPRMPAPMKGLPPFCHVMVASSPTSDSLINIEIWIPLGKKWNHKFEQVGCGGFCGTLLYQYPQLARAIGRGYAAAATDDGNQTPAAPDFALGHPEKIVDFGYRALKATTDAAKTVIAAYAGEHPRRSYFNGCSDGGREALMEAQRYPEDFDGIIVGAPANAWTQLVAGFVANAQALLKTPESYIPPSKLPILSKAVLASCKQGDSGAPGDTFLSDPARCNFDPTVVQCKASQDPETCLTPAQVETAKAVYDGVRDSTGKSVVPGFVPGNEDDPGNWPVWFTGSSREANLVGNDKPPGLPLKVDRGGMQGFYGKGFFAKFVYQDPRWDIQNFDAAKAIADSAEVGKSLDSTDPDLRRFRKRGGKLIHYHGWTDMALTPLNSIAYYNQVKATLGGNIQDFYRLFMVPGMGHCGGGPGANQFGAYVDAPVVDADHDLLSALDRWVERGVAPNKIIATHFVDNDPKHTVAFQRPLCLYPQVAHYDGKSDPNKARSFTCR